MTEEKKQSLHPTSELLCKVYKKLYENKEVFFPLRDDQIEKIDTVVKTVYSDYFGFVRFPTDEDKAVVFFCLLIKDHPVVDGNKRLAVLWLEIFCKALNLKMKLPDDITLDIVAVSVEKSKNIDNDRLFNLVKRVFFNN